MTASTVFEWVNTLVLPAWILLLVAPRWKYRNPLIYAFALIMAGIYAFYIFSGFSSLDPEAFGSLEGVKNLFTKDEAVLAGWVHYLTFDLLIGNWVVNQSIKYNIKHYMIIPALFFCFMLGPVGYLIFTLVKLAKTKSLA